MAGPDTPKSDMQMNEGEIKMRGNEPEKKEEPTGKNEYKKFTEDQSKSMAEKLSAMTNIPKSEAVLLKQLGIPQADIDHMEQAGIGKAILENIAQAKDVAVMQKFIAGKMIENAGQVMLFGESETLKRLKTGDFKEAMDGMARTIPLLEKGVTGLNPETQYKVVSAVKGILRPLKSAVSAYQEIQGNPTVAQVGIFKEKIAGLKLLQLSLRGDLGDVSGVSGPLNDYKEAYNNAKKTMEKDDGQGNNLLGKLGTDIEKRTFSAEEMAGATE